MRLFLVACQDPEQLAGIVLEDVNFAIPTAAVVKSAGFVALYCVCAAPARWACAGFIKKSITRAVDEFGEEEEAMAVEPPQAPPAGALVLRFCIVMCLCMLCLFRVFQPGRSTA